MTDFPIPSPPPELVQQWAEARLGTITAATEAQLYIATQAASWGYQQGANAELEACIEWLGDAPVVYNDNGDLHPGSYLRDARRPLPSSKKRRGLIALQATNLKKDDPLLYQEILNAIEGLPND